MKYDEQNKWSFDIVRSTELLTAPICTDEVQSEFRNRLDIDSCNINQCCIDQPGLISEAATGYEMANAEVSLLKDLVAGAYAFLDPGARQTIEASGGRATEGKVEAMIKGTDDYRALQAKYHAAQFNAGRWKALVEACKHRKDALITIAANYRAEGQGDVTLRKLEQVQEDYRKMSQS